MTTSEEIKIISQYLTGKTASAQAISLYQKVADRFSFTSNNKESRVWIKCMRHPFLLRFADAYYAFHYPRSIFRQRLWAAFAILESQKENTGFFLPKQRSFFYLFIIGWTAFKSVCKLILSYPLVWML